MSEININLEEINSLDFNNIFMNINSNEEYSNYFFSPSGKEHYRLLSYLSTKFNNSNIIDIGTLHGHSAYALSYNKSNVVHTFDIKDFVNNEIIKNTENIKYHFDDLFNEKIQMNWITFILNCPFIVLDVCPHNGEMEIAFFRFLQKIDYQGLIFFDDIHHFEDMREKFWKLVPENIKYDVTRYGHWSGSGLVSFNPNLTINIT
jgi:hypothetical protein